MQERYFVLKKIYPDYLIFFLKKGEIKCIGETKLIVDIFGNDIKKFVNYLVINNLEIVEIKKYTNNLYDLYYCKASMIKILKDYLEKRRNDFCER